MLGHRVRRSSMVFALLVGLAASTGGAGPAHAAVAFPNQTFDGIAYGPDLMNRVVAVGPFNGVGTNVLVDSTANPDG